MKEALDDEHDGIDRLREKCQRVEAEFAPITIRSFACSCRS